MRRHYLNILMVGFLALAFYLQIQVKLTPNDVPANADLPRRSKAG